MNNKFSKLFLIFITIFFIYFITSCNKNKLYKITYNLNGGYIDNPILEFRINDEIDLPIPKRDDYIFKGWYETFDFNSKQIYKIDKGTKEDKFFYAKWSHERDPEGLGLNQKKFNGNGAKFGIMVSPVEKFDPFNENYNSSDKALKQSIQKSVETAYNIKIEYIPWSNYAAYGPDRVNFIKQSFIDKSFYNKNIYVINIDSMWVAPLVKAGVIAELYNIKDDSGIFKDYNFVQSDISNSMLNIRNKVYGYDFSNPYGDNYLYYNISKLNELSITDPVELWFNGEWTWDSFNDWVKSAQLKLDHGECVLDLLQGDYVIGQSAALGKQIINLNTMAINFNSSTIKKIFERSKIYYNEGYQSKYHGTQDISREFLNGKTLMTTGKVLYLKDENYFNSNINFEIGVVPYPIENNQNVKIYTAPYSYYDVNNHEIYVDQPIIKRNGEILKTIDNDAIYGIDLSDTNYLNTITNNSYVYSIINYNDIDIEIPINISFNIIYDLNNKFKNYYGVENIANKLADYTFDYRSMMSVQYKKCVEYDSIIMISNSIKECFSPVNWYALSHSIVSSDIDIEESLNSAYYRYLAELEDCYK